MSAEEEAKLVEYMRAMEGEGSQTTLFDLLIADGISVPDPETLDDSQVTQKLWEVIHGIYDHGAILYNTDHLSDRELYTKLFADLLLEDHPIVPDEFAPCTHVIKAEGEAIISLDPIIILRFWGMRRQDLAEARRIVEESQTVLLRSWRNIHGDQRP